MLRFIPFSILMVLLDSLHAGGPAPGGLLLDDKFEREKIGAAWQKRIGSFSIQDGHLVGTEKPGDGHGAVIQAPVSFSDAVIEFSFRIVDGRAFNFVVNDKQCRTVHAGHICRVAVSMKGFRLGDDKEGVMRKDIFAMRKDPNRKREADVLLVGRSRNIPFKLTANQWYRLRVAIIGDEMQVVVDDKPVGRLKSPGIGHKTKTDFGFTVKGTRIEFDNVRAWKPDED